MTHFLENAIAAINRLQQWHETSGYFGAINDKTLTFGDDGTCRLALPSGGIHSAHFMAPEQTGRIQVQPDIRTDIYSLGVLFYKWLTERLPFDANDSLELAYQHMAVMPQAPSTVNSHVPIIFSRIVMRMLAKEPTQRYQTTLGLQHDLEACLEKDMAESAWQNFELGLWDEPDRITFPERLYGREAETEKLSTAFAHLEKEMRCLLVVGGYSGVGKTSLTHGIRPFIESHHGLFLEGKFDQFQRQLPYTALSEKQLTREFKRLEKTMTDYARNLEFEKAAATRDELFRIKEQLFGAAVHDKGI